MHTLTITYACMSTVLNGTFIEHFIPEYDSKHFGTPTGNALYKNLILDFQSKGFTHVQVEDLAPITIQAHIDRTSNFSI